MNLRTKMLLLLCTVALVPAVLTAWLDVRILHSLGDELAGSTSRALAEQGLAAMNRVANEYAGALDREARRAAMMIRLQAARAERLLAAGGETGTNAYFEDDFEAARAELDLRPSAHAGAAPRSLAHQVFRAAPGVERDAVEPAARALVPMRELYTRLRDPGDPVVVWHYVALENGLTATWPGHGGYPARYDARERPWYRAQRERPGFQWHRPHIDASSGTLVINATMPLYDGGGRFAGVTGIDLDLIATFDVIALPPHLRAGSEIMQVAALPAGEGSGAVVLARGSGSHGRGAWETLPELQPFALADATATRTVIAAMQAGEDGYVTVSKPGRERFVVYRGFGEAGGYLVLSVPVESATRAAIDATAHARDAIAGHTRALLAVFAVATALVVGVALLAARHVTRPLNRLGGAVRRLSEGDYGVRVDIGTGDEIADLGRAFNDMVPRLAEHARVREALGLAREIQQQLLPTAPPHVPGWEIAAVARYSDQTGGDYFDYLPLTPDARRLGVIVADVSGHGIGPALLMATTRALLHGAQAREGTLGDLLTHVNAQLSDDVGRGHFVTLFILCVEGGSPRIEWAGAGHDAALLFEHATGRFTELAVEDIPLAVDGGWAYRQAGARQVAAGDIVVMGTDGIWEAANADGERYGRERMQAYVAANASASAEAIGEGLLADVTRFRAGARQADDITIAIVKHAGAA